MAEPTSNDKNWTNFVALSTALMAVLAAITTLYVGKNSSRAIFFQAQASDQWSFYQAKSIKSNLYELHKQDTELKLLAEGDKVSQPVAAKLQDIIAGSEKNTKRYEKEKDEIKATAEKHEHDRDIAQAKGGNFGYALIFEQIAIMLSSISILMKKRPLWYVGLAMLVCGLFYFVDGILLFY